MKKFISLVIIAISMYACSTVPITGRQQLNLVSDQEILSLSLQQYNDYIKTAKKSTDPAATAMVHKVGQNIANAVAAYFKVTGMEELLSNFQWEFTLVDDSQVNAFCMPGGKIVVYTGILPYTQNEAGLAVVIGHEVAHAIAKHANERMSQQMVAQGVGAGLGAALDKTSPIVKTMGSTVFGLGAQYGVMMPYGRKQELEADRIGLILMAIAGYDPNVAIPFWQRMSQQGSGGTLELLSTHPSDDRRIAEMRKVMPEAMEYYHSIWGGSVSPSTPAPKANTSNEWRF
jgi:predicted Zn-dependent protease